MRVYLSGKITGNPNYKQDFQRVESLFDKDKHTIINPAGLGEVLKGETRHEDFMDVCFHLLATCDHIVMIDGWEESRGANQEYGFARCEGMAIYTEEEMRIFLEEIKR